MTNLFRNEFCKKPNRETRRTLRPGSLFAFLLATFMVGSVMASSDGTTTRLVTRTDGGPKTPYGDDVSEFTSTSSDGRFAVFASRAKYLEGANVTSLNTSYFNVYLYDREGNSGSGQLYLISKNYNSYNEYATGDSRFPTISSDGRFIAFQSSASDLLPPGKDTNEKTDIFIFDVACIQDGLFYSDFQSIGYTQGCGEYGGFLYQSITMVSKPDISMGFAVEADGDSGNSSQDPYPRIAVLIDPSSSKNPYVFFESSATNLVANDTNGYKDIFVRNVVSNKYTYCLTCTVPGSSGAVATNGASYGPVVSETGTQLAFVSDANNMTASAINNAKDVFLMSTDFSNLFASPSAQLISRNPTTLIAGNDNSTYPSITANGSKISFQSLATNLLTGDGAINYSDIFLWESPNTLKRLSVEATGLLGDNNSYNPRISANGNAVAFTSFADNLVEGDNNIDCLVQSNGRWVDANCADVFVREVSSTEIWRVSITTDGMEAHERSGLPFLSDDAKYIYFLSYASLEDMGDNVNVQQVFFRNQGSPPGNPNIQPTYWIFYGYPNVGTSHRFYLKFLGEQGVDTLTLADEASTSESHFTITENTCTPATYSGGDTCYIEVKYLPLTTNDHHTGVIRIPLSNDDRSALTIGLEGYGRFMYYIPAVVQQAN